MENKFFEGVRSTLIVSIVFWCLVALVAWGQDWIEGDDLTQIATRKVLDLDNMVILPTTKTVVIRTIEKQLDAEGSTVNQKAGKNFIYMDREDNPESEENEFCDDFTVFMGKLALTKAKVKQAIREMEGL